MFLKNVSAFLRKPLYNCLLFLPGVVQEAAQGRVCARARGTTLRVMAVMM